MIVRRHGASLLTLAIACLAQPLAAQTVAPEAVSADDQPQAPADEIVVVGTSIKGAKTTEALPVRVVNQDDIANTAAVSGDELVRSIPQMGDVSFNSSYLPNSSNSARGDVGSMNLRNLGVGNTLVLLNGRRVVAHPTSRADDNLVPVLTYNSNAIPVSGIERLEVLLDGAGAIYGSDAVAGVVNTVLRKDYNGAELSATMGLAEGTHMSEQNLSGIIGKNFGGGRGNVTLFADYTHRNALKASDYDYTASADKTPLFEGTDYAGIASLDGRSTITPWGSFTTYRNTRVNRGTTPLTNTSGQFHIQPANLPGCLAALPGGVCLGSGANTADALRPTRFDAPAAYDTDIMPRIDRLNLFLTGTYEIAPSVELFGEAGYYRADSRSVQNSTGTLSSGPIIVPASNYWNPFGATRLPDGSLNPNRLPGINAPAAGVPVTLSSYNFSDVGPNIVKVTNQQYRLLGGVRFDALGINWETAASYSEARAHDRSDGISATLLQRQLALATPDAYNPFNGANPALPSRGDITPSNAAALDAIRIQTERKSKTTLAMWDLRGSKRDLLRLPAGDLGMAIGGEVRRETQLDDRDARLDGTVQFVDAINGFVNGSDLVGSSPSPDTRGRRTVFGGYAELAVPIVGPDMNVPLVRRLDMQLAGRFEHYSDVGSVAKPKIAAAWDIIDGVRLRGSYSEGFKAPNLEQLNATLVTRSNTRTDFIRCEAQLRTGAIADFSACRQSFATTAQRSGNPDLKPETSRNWTVGAVLEPKFLGESAGRVTFTVDYWNIKQKGVVGLFGEGNALINDYWLRTKGQSDPNVIRAEVTQADIDLFAGSGLAPVGRVLFVKDQYVNLLPQEAAGVDFGFNWRSPGWDFGRFNLNVNAAYLDKFFLRPSPPIQALLDARTAGEINKGTNIAEQGDLVRRNGKPQWKWNASLTWDMDAVQIGAYTAYTGSVEDTGLVNADGDRWVIDGRQTANLYVQFNVGEKGAPFSKFRFGVRNLFNQAPPLSSDGYLGSLYNPYGRYWYVNVRAGF